MESAPAPVDEDVLDLVEDDVPPPKAAAPVRQEAAPAAQHQHAAAGHGSPAAPGASAVMMWHIHDNGQSYGPMSTDDLIISCKEGRFTTAANIWKDGLAGWVSILKLEGLSGRAI
jgi:hypothetical protein